METARSLRHDERCSPVRRSAPRGIVLPSLVLAALGTVAAQPGHASGAQVRSDVVSARSCVVGSRPWLNTTPTHISPSISASTAWMYTVTIKKPGTSRATFGTAWMYWVTVNGQPIFRATFGTAWMFTAQDSRANVTCRAHAARA